MGNRQIEHNRIGGLGLRGTGPRELAGRRCGGRWSSLMFMMGRFTGSAGPRSTVVMPSVVLVPALSCCERRARTTGRGLRLPGARRGARLCAQSLRAARTSVAGSRPRPAARRGGEAAAVELMAAMNGELHLRLALFVGGCRSAFCSSCCVSEPSITVQRRRTSAGPPPGKRQPLIAAWAGLQSMLSSRGRPR
jgi:hypothetical protein